MDMPRHPGPVISLVVLWGVLWPGPARARAARPLITVGMDARSLKETAHRSFDLLALQRKLALRLTQAGFAVVSVEGSPRIRLRFRVGADGLRVEAHTETAKPRRSRPVPRGKKDLAGVHLEVIHNALELTRQAREALPDPTPQSRPAARAPEPRRPPAEARPPASRPRAAHRPARAPAPRPWGLEFSGGVFALYRPGGVDAMVRGSGRIGIWRGMGLRGSVGFAPSLQDYVHVYDVSLQAGISWRISHGESIYLEPALLLGVLQHYYSGEQVTDGSDLRWNFLASLVLEGGWNFHRYFGLRLWLSPGLTALDPSLQVTPTQRWSRSVFRLEAGFAGVLVLR